MKIEIFTDGACSGNPGNGGYGILMRVPEKNYERRYAKGYRLTTNNRMELLAVIVALEKLKSADNEVHIFTDSKYVSDAINKKWIHGWAARGFTKIKNPDLWQQFYPLLLKFKPSFHWVKGHAGHVENEICDQLAVKASQSLPLLIDDAYENPSLGGMFNN